MPNVSEEEWDEESMVWLSPRQMFAVALLINEVMKYGPEDFDLGRIVIRDLVEAKTKLWDEVKPMLVDDEIEEAEVDSDLGPG